MVCVGGAVCVYGVHVGITVGVCIVHMCPYILTYAVGVSLLQTKHRHHPIIME